MKIQAVIRAVVALQLLTVAGAVLAQLPMNNDAGKARCNVLAAAQKAIDAGIVPGPLVAATRGVPGRDFFVLAVDRAQAKQHYVACTMYFLAAIADRAGNGGHQDATQASNEAIVGGSELKLARGFHLKMAEHATRIKMKVEEMTGQPLSLTPPQTSAVLNAATTMPIVVAGSH